MQEMLRIGLSFRLIECKNNVYILLNQQIIRVNLSHFYIYLIIDIQTITILKVDSYHFC